MSMPNDGYPTESAGSGLPPWLLATLCFIAAGSPLFWLPPAAIDPLGGGAILLMALGLATLVHRQAVRLAGSASRDSLERAEARAEQIIAANPEPQLLINANGRIVNANRRALEFLGYSDSELRNLSVEDLVPQRYRLGHAAHRQSYLAHATARSMSSRKQLTVVQKGGRECPVSIGLAPLECGDGQQHTLVTILDLSEIVAAQTALEAYRNNLERLVEQRSREVISANQRMAHILSSSPVPVFVVDEVGRVILWNKACETYFAISAEQIIGSDNIWPAFYDTPRPVLAQLVLTADTAGIHALYQARATPAPLVDGAWQGESYFPHLSRWLAFTAVPLRDAQGRITGAVETLLDITAYKEAANALDTARKEAEKATRAKSEFLAHMSHEIRTPLNGVIGLAQIGLREHAGQPAGATFARIEESGKHLLGLISDILDFSKIEAGKLEVEQVEFSLPELVDRLIDLTVASATRQGLAFIIEEGMGLPERIRGDSLRLMQCLINLIGNAIKFTRAGEVRLRLGIEGGILRIHVSDTGIGMDAETLERLFIPFQQGESSTTRRFGGTGLGLSITRQLVQLMGGEIAVTSSPGKGSTFSISLMRALSTPQADTTRYQISHGVSPRTRSGKPVAKAKPVIRRLVGLRLLGVDDNEVNRIVLGDLLQHEGATVDMVEDGKTAIEKVQSQAPRHYDAIITDIEMPGLDGYAVARTLRASHPHLPIFGLTAHASPEDREKCLAAGMNEHLTKPLDLNRLVDALHRSTRDVVSSKPADTSVAHQSVSSPPPSTPPAAAFDAGDIAWPAQIDPTHLLSQFGGRPEFVRKLLNTAYRANLGTLDKLREAIAQGQHDEMRKLGHGLRGMAASIGAHALHQRAEALDQAEPTAPAQIDSLARKTADELAALLEGISRFLADE